jgi:GGDEF domain-containing protein
MLYTLTPESDDADIDAAMEALTDVIKNALRQSDVITQNGDNQILIILLHAIPSDIDIVTERIKTNWSDTDLSRQFSIDYEIDMIR